MKYLYLLMFVMSSLIAIGQVESPPSLLLGLSGLTGAKGNIDVALLAEIIAQKQGELKKEFVKREFYDKLQSRNYVVWEYAYNTLEVLLNSKNKQAISKEMLEYSANLALVYSFTETYLQVSDRLCNSHLNAVVLAWDSTSKERYKGYFQCNTIDRDLKDKLWLSTLKKSDSTGLNAILIDLVFDLMRSNKTLKSLGFFQSQLPLGEQFYQEHNQYLLTEGKLRRALDTLRERMNLEMMVLINYYYVIKMAVNKDLNIKDLMTDSKDNTTKVDTSKFKVSKLFEDLENMSKVIASSSKPTDVELSGRISRVLAAFLDFNSRQESKNVRTIDGIIHTGYTVDDLYYLQEVTFPLIVKLVTEYGLDSNYINVTQNYRQTILKNLVSEMTSILAKRDTISKITSGAKSGDFIKELNATDYSAFVDMLKQIFELDEAVTYEAYIKTLRNVAEIFSDNNVGRLVFNLTDYLEKYTMLDKEKNAINIDVEEIIIQLLNKYESRLQNNRVNFYFSIGLHQTMNIKYKEGYELESDSAVTLRNLAFASEKIGVKVKLMDWKRRRSFDYGEKYSKSNKTIKTYETRSPLVNDVYWLFYGSGLLYNIVNTTTGKDFDYPILGTGIGIAFYNALDFNIFYCSPMVSSESLGESLKRRQMLGFSFDIKLGEYIAAVRKKRAERKDAE